ncbi:MAG TPA: hypothetical protein PL168_07560 [Methanobacterium sp.]|jgi:hypothetical protein|nr:hypothetical protein [Methanobacterium sp.]HOI40571.1 hypothetical protein [Methanobacterium sp.]
MKWQIVILSALVLVLMSFSAVSAYEEPSGTSESQISQSTMASIAPVMKGSRGGSFGSSSSKSSSSKKIKIGDGDDDDYDDDSSGGFSWMYIVVVIIIIAIIGFAVWYLFLR